MNEFIELDSVLREMKALATKYEIKILITQQRKPMTYSRAIREHHNNIIIFDYMDIMKPNV